MAVLGLATGTTTTAWCKEKKDSLILQRIYDYKASHLTSFTTQHINNYTKLRFNVERRNPTMWLIPSLYVMANGDREYLRESYCKVRFRNDHNFSIDKEVFAGNLRRKTMPPLLEYFAPTIYDVTIYDKRILSPFHKSNRRRYRFTQQPDSAGLTRLDFQPRRRNTQLVSGYAWVDSQTGRIVSTAFKGEFDMITFQTQIEMEHTDSLYSTPKRCTTEATFRFVGNRISSQSAIVYNCPTALPESINRINSDVLMDSLRAMPLTATDSLILKKKKAPIPAPSIAPADSVASALAAENAPADSTAGALADSASAPSGLAAGKKSLDYGSLLKKIFWDTIGETLFTPLRSSTEQWSIGLSPIINPLYMSYSQSKGFSYKMRLRMQYIFSPHRYLTFNPMVGYNFKIRQLYFNAPLQITFNPKRNGYVLLEVANGNRISNSSVLDVIHEQYGDSIRFENSNVNKFDNTYLRLYTNIMAFHWLNVEAGVVFHRRNAVMKEVMQQYGMPTDYRSFAPMITLKFSPFKNDGPTLAANWERGIVGVVKSNIDYERWEFDGQWKHRMPGLRLLNMRLGTGFYLKREQDYFMDYQNFNKTYLPGGWDDDWSGDFQLLDGDIYNSSHYYIRGNLSYESPLLLFTVLPYVGKFIEKERLYVSSVIVEHHKPYFEVGYSFTNRYISAGVFTNIEDYRLGSFGFKLGFELFNRW